VNDKVLDHAGVVLMPSGKFEHIRTEPTVQAQALEVYATTGACMLMRRADFDAVGGFDEVFVNGCEDIDLCLKVRAMGKSICVAPSSKILHHVSLSRSRVSLQNEKNSQYLYSKWRKDIKLQLTKCWIHLLVQADDDYASYIDGKLTKSFKSQPHIASMTIAEAALQREEARWAKELSFSKVSSNWSVNLKASGLAAVSQMSSYLASSEVEVCIAHLRTACNFYVCGRLLEDFDPERIALKLEVNNSQEKLLRLEKGHVVNVGVINPLVTSTGLNRFKINVFHTDETGQLLGPAENTMLITHFVVDDQVVKPTLIEIN
jgi:hypothetical protein